MTIYIHYIIQYRAYLCFYIGVSVYLPVFVFDPFSISSQNCITPLITSTPHLSKKKGKEIWGVDD